MNGIDIDESLEYKMIDVNEIKTKPSSVFIAAIEHNQFIRNSWFQKRSIGDKFESWSDQKFLEKVLKFVGSCFFRDFVGF